MAKKILLADDSVTMRKVFEMTFAAEDVTITAVASGAEAVNRAREMRPDLVVADLSMPGRNGYDVCAELKADPALARIPVLILHGSSASYDEAKARSVKADGEIAKPFETQTLIEKAEAAMAAAAAPPPAPHEPMGPITSLASPIEAIDADVVIDTEEAPRPVVVEPRQASARPPATPPQRPMPPPPAGLGKPGMALPPKPPTFVPHAPPPKPPAFMAPPRSPAAPPKSPPPKAVPVKPESLEVEITIEAEMPAEGSQASELPSFDGPLETKPAQELGTELPLPPAGLPAPPAGLPAPPAGLPAPPAGLPLPPPGLPLPPTMQPPAITPTSSLAHPPLAHPPLAHPPLAHPPFAHPPATLAPLELVEKPTPLQAAAAAPAPTPIPAPISPPAGAPLPPLEPGKPYEPIAYDAISKLSREIIERIVWEVVPDLAEKIIREELDRLVEGRRAQ